MARSYVARPLVVVLLGSALALGLMGCGSAASHHSASAPRGHRSRVITTPSTSGGGATTQEVVFSPYTAQGTMLGSMHVTQTVSGTCVSPGVAGTSSYRCFAQPGSTAYDPCFAPPHATSGPLVCVADPAESQAVSFDVANLPASTGAGPPTQPWALQLSNGQACIFVSAAWPAGQGPFACPSPAGATSSSSEADCHSPQKSGSGFVAACQARESSQSTFQTLPVIKIWS